MAFWSAAAVDTFTTFPVGAGSAGGSGSQRADASHGLKKAAPSNQRDEHAPEERHSEAPLGTVIPR